MKYRQVAKRRRYRVAQVTPFWRFPAVGLTALTVPACSQDGRKPVRVQPLTLSRALARVR